MSSFVCSNISFFLFVSFHSCCIFYSAQGHVAMLHNACWNPKTKDEFISSSDDGYVFFFNISIPSGMLVEIIASLVGLYDTVLFRFSIGSHKTH